MALSKIHPDSVFHCYPTLVEGDTHSNLAVYAIPAEIVGLVADYLDSKDLRSLRLTCRVLNERVLPFFGQQLTTVWTDLSSQGLRELAFIASSPMLCRYVQRLCIYDECHGRMELDQLWARTFSNAAPRRCRVEALCEILDSLEHCHSFEVQYDAEPKDCTVWPALGSYGAARILMRVLGQRRMPVKSLALRIAAPLGLLGDFDVEGKLFRSYDLENPLFLTAISCLQSLTLHYGINSGNVGWTVDLLKAAVNLKKLHLIFDMNKDTMLLFNRLASADTLPALEELTLKFGLWSSAKNCTAFLSHFRSSLRDLSFERARLALPGWVDVFQDLRTEHRNLTSLKLHNLSEGTETQPDADESITFPGIFDHPFFCETYRRPSWIDEYYEVTDISYTGVDMQNALSGLMQLATTNEHK